MLTERISQALALAVQAHHGQQRKGTAIPYVSPPNARAIVSDLLTIGSAVFERFSAGRDDTLWYYRKLASIFSERHAPMAAELAAVVAEMERLANLAK